MGEEGSGHCWWSEMDNEPMRVPTQWVKRTCMPDGLVKLTPPHQGH